MAHSFQAFIHGGALATGGSSTYNPNFLLDFSGSERVVLVTINYRLGPLGFLSVRGSDGSVMSGNQGFRDQAMGLQWIQDNIEAFGGDKNQVNQ